MSNDHAQTNPEQDENAENIIAEDAVQPDDAPVEAADQASEADGEVDSFVVLEKLQAENAELKDRALRAMAEMENVRRRAEREKTDASQYAISSFARDLLAVVDNLRRTLDAVPDAGDSQDPVLESLVEGVEMTERDMIATLAKHGLKAINPMGEKFDPNLHQAMFEVPDTSVPHNTVVQVAQMGFTIGERVLRPAMVGVSKGGARTPKPSATQAAAARDAAEAGSEIDREV